MRPQNFRILARFWLFVFPLLALFVVGMLTTPAAADSVARMTYLAKSMVKPPSPATAPAPVAKKKVRLVQNTEVAPQIAATVHNSANLAIKAAPKAASLPARQWTRNAGTNEQVWDIFSEKKISVDYQDIPLGQVIHDLGEELHVNFVVLWPEMDIVGIDRSDPVTLRLDDVQPGAALEAILEFVSAGRAEKLSYNVDRGLIWINVEKSLPDRHMVKTYYVADLVAQPSSLNAGLIARSALVGGFGQGGGGAQAQGGGFGQGGLGQGGGFGQSGGLGQGAAFGQNVGQSGSFSSAGLDQNVTAASNSSSGVGGGSFIGGGLGGGMMGGGISQGFIRSMMLVQLIRTAVGLDQWADVQQGQQGQQGLLR